MKKQKAKIAVKDLKARKDIKGGSHTNSSGSQISSSKPTGGSNVTGSGSSVTYTPIRY